MGGENSFPTTGDYWIPTDIAAIVKKYLDPTFQCDVQTISSKTGHEHSIITVPPHESVPICAKASGPHGSNGKPQGIEQGTYYTRKAGPESSPITTPAEWSPIIRRCAMHERTSILSAINAALQGTSTIALENVEDKLKKWHDAARTVFLDDLKKYNATPNLPKSHCIFSYFIERADGQVLDNDQMITILREVNGEVHDLVNSGWSMFYVFNRAGIAPTFVTDPNCGQGANDFAECSLLRDPEPVIADSVKDMWRISPDGLATIIRPYWEDFPDYKTHLKVATLNPRLVVQNVAELVRHSRGIAERYKSPTSVSFRCEWIGLAGRVLHDPLGAFFSHDNTPTLSDQRITTGEWPVAALKDGWPEIVATLVAPLFRAFPSRPMVSAEWVRGFAKSWRK